MLAECWPGRARLLWRRLRRRLGPAAAREGFCRVGRVLPAPEPPPAALTHPAAPSTRAGRGEERGGRGTGRGGRSAPRGAAVPGAALKEPPGAAPRSSAGPRGARGSGILHRPRSLRVGFPGAARVRRVTLAGQPTSSALVPAGESKQYEEQKRHQRFQQATNPNTKGW